MRAVDNNDHIIQKGRRGLHSQEQGKGDPMRKIETEGIFGWSAKNGL